MDGYGSTTPAALAFAAMLDQWNQTNPGAPRVGGGPGDRGLGWLTRGTTPPPPPAGGGTHPGFIGPPIRQQHPGPIFHGPPLHIPKSVNRDTEALLARIYGPRVKRY